MNNKIIAITAAAAILLCGCSQIENPQEVTLETTLPTTVSESVVTEITTLVTEITENAEPLEPIDNWQYSFGKEFIEENGLEYIWQQLDEETKVNLGEAMNAIRSVGIYCPLSVGFKQEEAQQFLNLLYNCTTYYTYDSNQIKVHIDQNGVVKGLTIYYLVNYENQAEEQKNELEAKISEIVSKMPKDNELEKLRYLHDYIVKNCTYSEDAQSPFTAYGALVEGKATCQGYADAMHILLSKAGFETIFATGEVYENNQVIKHKWNYVKLSDGSWYAIDTTWDDPQNKQEKDFVGYDYFLISDSVIEKNHTKFENAYFTLPEANLMSLNFHTQMGWYPKNKEEAYTILKEQTLSVAKNGGKYLYLRFDSISAMNEAYEYICSGTQDANKMVEIISEMNEIATRQYNTTQWVKSANENVATLTITLNYLD